MKLNIVKSSIGLSIATGILLSMTACGSSSSDSTDSSVSGTASDGYLYGSTVCLDINNNNLCDTDEPSATTAVNGTYSLSLTADQASSDAPLLIVGGKDVDTGLAFVGSLKAPLTTGTSVNITPVTTMVAAAVASGATIDDAKQQVATTFGIPVDLVDKDPVAEFEANPQLAQVTQDIQRSVEVLASANSDVNNTISIYTDLASSLAEVDAGSGISGLAEHAATTSDNITPEVAGVVATIQTNNAAAFEAGTDLNIIANTINLQAEAIETAVITAVDGGSLATLTDTIAALPAITQEDAEAAAAEAAAAIAEEVAAEEAAAAAEEAASDEATEVSTFKWEDYTNFSIFEVEEDYDGIKYRVEDNTLNIGDSTISWTTSFYDATQEAFVTSTDEDIDYYLVNDEWIVESNPLAFSLSDDGLTASDLMGSYQIKDVESLWNVTKVLGEGYNKFSVIFGEGDTGYQFVAKDLEGYELWGAYGADTLEATASEFWYASDISSYRITVEDTTFGGNDTIDAGESGNLIGTTFDAVGTEVDLGVVGTWEAKTLAGEVTFIVHAGEGKEEYFSYHDELEEKIFTTLNGEIYVGEYDRGDADFVSGENDYAFNESAIAKIEAAITLNTLTPEMFSGKTLTYIDENITISFNEDGSYTYTDPTSTITGTWMIDERGNKLSLTNDNLTVNVYLDVLGEKATVIVGDNDAVTYNYTVTDTE